MTRTFLALFISFCVLLSAQDESTSNSIAANEQQEVSKKDTQKFSFDDADTSSDFYGVYITNKFQEDVILDLYWLGLDRDESTFEGDVGRQTVQTLGGRFEFNPGGMGFGAELEGAYQFGEIVDSDISAFMVTGDIGYAVPLESGNQDYTKVYVGAGYASGDDTPGDGDAGTFNQLFPLAHKWLGIADVIGRQNLIDLHTRVKTKVSSFTFLVTGHVFWRADEDDALYGVAGTASRAGGAGTRTLIGSEIDAMLTYHFDRHARVTIGYAHFFTADFVQQTGSDDDIDFFYLETQYSF